MSEHENKLPVILYTVGLSIKVHSSMSGHAINNNSKYSSKIESFLSNINPSIRLDPISHKSQVITKIYDSVRRSIEKNHTIKIEETSILKPMHIKDQYPMSYILFRCLTELNLMDQILIHTPNLSDFRDFVDWHRENIEFVNFDKIHQLMEKLSDSRIDTNDVKDQIEILIDVYRSMFRTTGPRKILHDAVYENKFISWDVQYDLESCTLKYTKYLIDDKHSVCVFAPVKDLDQVEGPDIEIVAMLIGLMENLAIDDRKTTVPVVNLTVMFSNQKKNVYPKTKILCCDNLNSGSTYPGRSITCWRREEFYKVLIHELFHYYSFDFFSSNQYYKQLEDMILIPAIEGTDMLNESYTESSTIIILSIVQYINDVYLIEKKVPEIDVKFTKYIDQFIRKEITFVLFQIAKILVIFDCDDVDDYINKRITICQNTSFRSYFIIKMLLLSNVTETLEMMDKGLTLNGPRLLELGDLINGSWKRFQEDEIRLETMNNFIANIKLAFASNHKDLSWMYRTCRMCVNDLIHSHM